MPRLIVILLVFGIMQSCIQNRNTDFEALRSASAGLSNSIENISQNNKSIYSAFQQRLTEKVSREKAEEWYLRADQIKKMSDEVYNEIEKVKSSIKATSLIEKSDKGNKNSLLSAEKTDLFTRLLRFKTEILQIHPDLNEAFQHTIPIAYLLQDKTDSSSAYFSKKYFSNTSDAGAIVILKDFQNRIRITENQLILYCFSQSRPYTLCGFAKRPRLLISQSSSYVKPGEKIEITAGIGNFTLEPNPKLYINNKFSGTAKDGTATSFIRAANKPGKYIIPVKATYLAEDGTSLIEVKHVEYEVSESRY